MYKSKKIIWLVVLAMLLSIVAPLGAAAAEDPLDDLVKELQNVYLYLDDVEKSDISKAKKGVGKISDAQWSIILGQLTGVVCDDIKSKFTEGNTGENTLEEALKQAALGAAEIYYATDETELKENLKSFGSQNKDTFQKLFGNEFQLEDLKDFLLSAKGELKGIDLWEGLKESNEKLITKTIPEAVKKAFESAAGEKDLTGKLSAIGWSTDLLSRQHTALVKAIKNGGNNEDELTLGQKAELALAKAWVRSEVAVKKGDNVLDSAGILFKDTITVDEEVAYSLYMGSSNLTDRVGYKLSDSSKISDTKHGTGKLEIKGLQVGTAQLIFYRDGEGCSAGSDWIAKVDITVKPKATSGGGGGGGGPAAPSSTEIKIDAGGTVSKYGATVEIPAKSFSENIKIAVSKVTDTSSLTLPAKGNLISDVLEITKDIKGDFTEPVTITIEFDKAKVADGDEVALYYYDEDNETWVMLDNIKVNWDKGTVSGDVNHFTKFAVLAVTPEAAPTVLTDIAGHWAEAEIRALVEEGAIAGYPGGTFKPNNNITRAEFATVLVKAFDLEAGEGMVFSDTENHWAKDDIATANAHGIIKGYSDEKFGPNDQITREQAAVMVAVAADLAAGEQALAFTDSAKISAWARSAVAAAAEAEIINGYPDGSFQPQGQATRAEAAVIFVRAIE